MSPPFLGETRVKNEVSGITNKKRKAFVTRMVKGFSDGGEGGIRTHVGSRPNAFRVFFIMWNIV